MIMVDLSRRSGGKNQRGVRRERRDCSSQLVTEALTQKLYDQNEGAES